MAFQCIVNYLGGRVEAFGSTPDEAFAKAKAQLPNLGNASPSDARPPRESRPPREPRQAAAAEPSTECTEKKKGGKYHTHPVRKPTETRDPAAGKADKVRLPPCPKGFDCADKATCDKWHPTVCKFGAGCTKKDKCTFGHTNST